MARRFNFWSGVFPWILWVLAFAALEWRGLKDQKDELPPLTHIIRRWVPGWLCFMGIGWLAYHFLEQYLT